MERGKIEKMKKLAVEIQKIFKNFYLAGGTVLMFKYNHRISEDLDFLSEKEFSFLRLSSKVRKIFNPEKEERFVDNIDFIIDGIKTSFVFFPFKNINLIEKYEKIKIVSDYDIFLNKIYCSGRRIETKDLIDFAFLYEKYGWEKEKVKKDFEKKFPLQNFEIYLGAILSVEDYPDADTKTLKIIKEVKKRWGIES
ncbi:MAG TPA: nucleotidyl transferase AbiEii/AbiGii toxin family protein [bacterium]|nr:nucleotidyl transferase AbiEii/AbiGii toxin family protein [bacterium]HOM27077.1 nucleotidyl transferase AbiEii/AbiGii toxin family protein [bacterium]